MSFQRILCLLSLFLTINVVAQPTISQTEFLLSSGDILNMYFQPYSAPTEGPEQVWDYSSLSTSVPNTVVVINPASSGITGLPASTLCTDLAGSVDCFLIDANGLHRTGLGGPNEDFPYQDPEYQFTFPINYTDHDTDSFYSSYITNGFNGIRRGGVSIDVTGYGTLLLPNTITVNDAMQVKVHEITIDSTDVFGSWQIASSDYITYYFYGPNMHGTILLMSSGSTTLSSGGNDTTFYPSVGRYYELSSGAGIANPGISDQLKIYPNPVEDYVMITNLGNVELCGSYYNLINMQAQVIQTGVLTTENPRIDIREFPAGIYVLNISKGNFFASKRFIKE